MADTLSPFAFVGVVTNKTMILPARSPLYCWCFAFVGVVTNKTRWSSARLCWCFAFVGVVTNKNMISRASPLLVLSPTKHDHLRLPAVLATNKIAQAEIVSSGLIPAVGGGGKAPFYRIYPTAAINYSETKLLSGNYLVRF